MITQIADVISPQSVAEGVPIRAADLLIAVIVLAARIGPEPIEIQIVR